MRVEVDSHALKHGLTEPEIRYAWENYLRKQRRSAPDEDRIIAIGATPDGSIVQMVAVVGDAGALIYHAMKPPTKGFLRELGLERRR